MKVGNRVFLHNPNNVQTYGEIVEITEDKIVIYVINGAYQLHISICEPPGEVRNDYNKAIDWFTETTEHQQLKTERNLLWKS